MSLPQISMLLIIWSLTSFVFEVPSGAWGDTIDRQLLLVLSAVVYAVGFSLWILLPTFLGFAAGFVLWGLSSAMMSGTFEALLYDELVDRGAEDRYVWLVGWSHSAAMTANLVASVAAAPLFALGGYGLVGWTSVAIAVVQGALAITLPVGARVRGLATPQREVVAEAVAVRYVAMLRAGVREASTAVDVRRVVILSSCLVGMTAYDEYFPLVARDHGVATATVPYLIGLVVLGQAIGTAAAGRTARMRSKVMGLVVVVGGAAISGGALVDPIVGFAAIAVGYGLLNNTMIVSEARLQGVITGPARAAVTSVHGLATELVALLVYGSFAVAAGVVSVPALVALLGIPVVVVGACVAHWMPQPQ